MAANVQESDLTAITTQKLSSISDKVNIQVNKDGTVTIGNSTEVPLIYSNAKRYGMFTSDVIEAKNNFQSVVIKIGKKVINSSDIITIEARGSLDNIRWTEWKALHNEDENEIKFYDVLKYLQYRITIISNDINAPVLDKIEN
jgi:hypothetical protein